MPIALMAGVLDPVDPSKLAKAPIQGFLKKPIELRELGDRVKALLATPVPVGPSPFSTVPATPARDLVKRAEEALPELRPEPVAPFGAPESMAPAGASEEVDLSPSELDEDLLVLTAEDLWPEETEPLPLPSAVAAPGSPDVQLELEELDLDSLQDLTGEVLPPMVPPSKEAVAALPAFDPETVFADEDETLVTLPGLDELEALPTDFRMVLPEPEPAPVVEPAGGHESFAHLPAAASLIGGAGLAAAAGLALSESHQIAPADLEPAPAAFVTPEAPAAGGQAPAAPGQAAQAPAAPVSSEQAQALVQALLADPVLVDALVKAVVARMGDQVLREIAWEVMPDLAGRLQQ